MNQETIDFTLFVFKTIKCAYYIKYNFKEKANNNNIFNGMSHTVFISILNVLNLNGTKTTINNIYLFLNMKTYKERCKFRICRLKTLVIHSRTRHHVKKGLPVTYVLKPMQYHSTKIIVQLI